MKTETTIITTSQEEVMTTPTTQTAAQILADAVATRYGFITDKELEIIVADPDHAETPCMIRFYEGRKTLKAYQVAAEIAHLERKGWTLRDVTVHFYQGGREIRPAASWTHPVTCSACSGIGFIPEGQAWSCTACGGLQAVNLPKSVSYELVKGQWATGEGPERYFDLSGHDENGKPYRRHGWFEPTTGLITQVG